jgi:hypothetical protein
VFVSCVLLSGLAVGYPGGLAAVADDLTNYGRHSADLADQQAEHKEIQSAVVAARERHQFKTDLCAQVARGTLPLPAAADHYLMTVADEPVILDRFREALPGDTDQERMAVNLVREVFNQHPLSADERRELLAQFRQSFGNDYPLALPAAAASADPRGE